MKQIPLLQGKALLIEMPDGASNISIEVDVWPSPTSPNDDHSLHWHTVNNERNYLMLPQGNWRIIGMLSEVTEEQGLELVDYFTTDEDFGKEDVFRDYKGETFYDTALESLKSAILAEGFMFSGDECPNQFCENGKIDVGYGEFALCGICDDFRVLCRERCLLLQKID